MKDIVCENLILTPMSVADYKEYLDRVVKADEIYIQYGLEPTKELLAAISEPAAGVIYYSVGAKAEGKTVGYVGVYPPTDGIEFYIYKEYRRRGYASEAVAAFSDAYLKGKIAGKRKATVAETLASNAAALALLQKIGFKKRAAGFKLDPEEGVGAESFALYEKTAI